MYPQQLKTIHAPPPYFFIQGGLEPGDRYAVSIIGTRKPSAYGRTIAEKIAGDLADAGFTIVSGLASGLDSVGHRAAPKGGRRTIAVLGCGVNKVYPYENRYLARDIIENGALLSDFFFNTKPDPRNFPQRNRIISGLSMGVVVVEAGEKSGTRITVNYALEQNREVFAIPGNIDTPTSAGTNALIKEGARLVQSAEDILTELAPMLPASARSHPRSQSPPPKMNRQEKVIWDLLEDGAVHIDGLIITVGDRLVIHIPAAATDGTEWSDSADGW